MTCAVRILRQRPFLNFHSGKSVGNWPSINLNSVTEHMPVVRRESGALVDHFAISA